MAPVDDPDCVPDVQRAMLAEIERAAGGAVSPGKLSRSEFYRAASAGFGVVQVGDSRGYGCFLIRKGVIYRAPSDGIGTGLQILV